MKVRGYSKGTYNKRFCFPVVAMATIILFLLLFISDLIKTGASEAVINNCRIALIVIFAINLLYVIAFQLYGTRQYQLYAADIIDYDENIDFGSVEVSPEYYEITYFEHNVAHTERIYFFDYGIKVKVRKDFEVPVFYTKNNGTIDRVVIPYSEKKNPTWENFKIK